jgi:hypothetical protein
LRIDSFDFQRLHHKSGSSARELNLVADSCLQLKKEAKNYRRQSNLCLISNSGKSTPKVSRVAELSGWKATSGEANATFGKSSCGQKKYGTNRCSPRIRGTLDATRRRADLKKTMAQKNRAENVGLFIVIPRDL